MKRLVLIVSVALLGAACARGSEGGSGLRLTAKGGDVRVLHDEVWRTVAGTISLARGDLVETGDRGRALVELPAGALELRPDTVLRIGVVPELDKGSLLASSVSGTSVRVGGVQVEADEAVYRLDRSFSVRVGVYSGEVSLPGSGWDGTVGALRQVGVVAETVPRGPTALQVDPGDPWDYRLLAPFIEIGGSLERYQRGLADQLPRQGGRDAIIRILQLDPQEALASVPERASVLRISEALVASVVASSVAPVRKIDPDEALRQVMALRDLGASWIVVAAEWQLARSVLDVLVQVTGLLSREAAPQAPSEATGPGSSGGAPSGSSGGTPGGGSGGGDPVDGPPEPPPPPPDCMNLVDCTVEDVLDLEVGGGVVPLP